MQGLNRGFLGGIIEGLLLAWPLLLMLGAVGAAKFAYRVWEKRRLAASGIEEIDRMDGRTFEKYMGVVFERLGYRVELTQYVGDYGADLVVRKDGVKTVIQAKRYKQSVGVRAIQEAVAAKGYYGCEAAMVATNSRFTRQAVTLAEANGVALWDRSRLVAALLSVKGEIGPAALAISTAASAQSSAPTAARVAPMAPVAPAASTAPTAPAAPKVPAVDSVRCATCGKNVSEKVRAYCIERPDRFGGQVYCYDHQRAASRPPATTGAAHEN